ncbi:MAG TPA: EAL domain-containing protein [Planctomycetaceae bacterium]|jgi:EAL domain-containing protein (putative c-di-GMP-specific phosphodiesterase class I)
MDSYTPDSVYDAHFHSVVESAIGAAVTPAFAEHTADSLWELTGSLTPQAPAQRVRISGQPFTVGRDCDNALQLANPTISRRHAELLLVEYDLYVRDISSRNGTFLNGRRVGNFEKLNSGDMLQFGTAVFTVRSPRAQLAEQPFNPNVTQFESDLEDFALANLQFDMLLEGPALIPFFQPIVSLSGGPPLGFEVLARSRLVGLETPASMFRVAGERGLEVELSELARRQGLRIAQQQGLQGELYLNTHPSELQQDRLSASLRRLRDEFPDARIVIEIHESAVTSLKMLSGLRGQLQELGMRLAYDDFGAGQSRLMELADVPPDVIKFDMCLIRGVSNASEERQSMIRSLVKMVRDLAVIPLAEGVETRDEAIACARLGFEMAQGFFFGRPSASPHRPLGQNSIHPTV